MRAFVILSSVLAALAVAGCQPESPEHEQARRMECSKAIMSNMHHSTANYADHQAYAKEVKEKCEGFEINGKPIEP
jgi:hypothetical protein